MEREEVNDRYSLYRLHASTIKKRNRPLHNDFFLNLNIERAI
jgi:hypothetical protein